MDVFEYGNPNASLILLQMIGDHDIEMIDHEFDLIQKAVSDELCLIACKVDDWKGVLSTGIGICRLRKHQLFSKANLLEKMQPKR